MRPISVTAYAELAAACRLDARATQRVFRSMVDALVRPGRLTRLDVPGGAPPAIVPLLAMCDLETSVAVLGEAPGLEDWESFVAVVTGARRAAASDAGWVVALDPAHAHEVLLATPGRPEEPEAAARVVLAVGRLHADDASTHPAAAPTRVELRGPGVAGTSLLLVDGLDPSVVAGLDRINRRYPAGLDTWLVDRDGRVAGLPRSVRATAEPAGRH